MNCLFLSAILVLTMPAAAADKPKPAASAAARLAEIQKKHKAAQDAFDKAVAPLTDTPEDSKRYEELWRVFDKAQSECFSQAVKIAKARPKSDVAFTALEWVLTIPRAYYLPAGKPAFELLTKYHATNPKIGKVVAWVGFYRPQQGESQAAATALIEAVAARNPDRTARGQAVWAKAWEAKKRFAAAEYKNSPDHDKLAAAAEKAFAVIGKDYGDCPRLIRKNAPTLGELAKKELFELRHLRVGKLAPDIEGEDLDGVKFKLRDYRGKVVVLDFWGDW
jgi:hypothetical protein